MAQAPRRSALLQTRSQDTRRRLIRAALDLWNERGFEEAFESITAEEIARAAGVSKGTFYFHFAHKEDILLEMSWATAELMGQDADAAMAQGGTLFEVADHLMSSLARRVSRTQRAAVLRATRHWARRPAGDRDQPANFHSFEEAWRKVIVYGCERDELPGGVDVDEVAALVQAATMDALWRWASSSTETGTALRALLCGRAEVILRGAAATIRS
jgi:AcrR family transcriptional regulator